MGVMPVGHVLLPIACLVFKYQCTGDAAVWRLLTGKYAARGVGMRIRYFLLKKEIALQVTLEDIFENKHSPNIPEAVPK